MAVFWFHQLFLNKRMYLSLIKNHMQTAQPYGNMQAQKFQHQIHPLTSQFRLTSMPVTRHIFRDRTSPAGHGSFQKRFAHASLSSGKGSTRSCNQHHSCLSCHQFQQSNPYLLLENTDPKQTPQSHLQRRSRPCLQASKGLGFKGFACRVGGASE